MSMHPLAGALVQSCHDVYGSTYSLVNAFAKACVSINSLERAFDQHAYALIQSRESFRSGMPMHQHSLERAFAHTCLCIHSL